MGSLTKRYTTGIDDQGVSRILAKDEVASFSPYELFPSFQIEELFYTQENPQSLNTRHFDKPYDIELPEGAIRLLKVRMPTKDEMTAELKQAGQAVPQDWTKFNLHNTDSVDYVYVLSGKITCVVGEEKLDLSAGDTLVQVGPEHTWVNDNDEPCYILCVMVGIASGGARKKMGVE